MPSNRSLSSSTYKGAVSEEVLTAEQERIERERGQATRWAANAAYEVRDVLGALDDALTLVRKDLRPYRKGKRLARRMINQAIFRKLVIFDPEKVEGEMTPAYAVMIPLARDLVASGGQASQNGREATSGVTNDTDPVFRGRCSYDVKWRGDRGDLRTPSSGQFRPCLVRRS